MLTIVDGSMDIAANFTLSLTLTIADETKRNALVAHLTDDPDSNVTSLSPHSPISFNIDAGTMKDNLVIAAAAFTAADAA